MTGRVVLLGGTGFIGHALATELRRRGADVAAVGSADVDLTSADADAAVSERLDEGTLLVVAARTRQAADGSARFAADLAITAAATSAVERARPAGLVYFSSFAVYGEDVDRLDIDEDTACAPSSYYGAARYAGEILAEMAARRAGVPLLVVRPSSVYGPGDETGAYGPGRFVREIVDRGEARVFGDGSETRDYVFVADVVRSVADLLELRAFGTYNIASGRAASFAEVVSILTGIGASSFDVVRVPREGPPRGSQRTQPSKLLATLPAFRFTPLEEGLAATLAAAR